MRARVLRISTKVHNREASRRTEAQRGKRRDAAANRAGETVEFAQALHLSRGSDGPNVESGGYRGPVGGRTALARSRRVQNGMHGIAHPPAHDPAGKDVDDEGNALPALPGRNNAQTPLDSWRRAAPALGTRESSRAPRAGICVAVSEPDTQLILPKRLRWRWMEPAAVVRPNPKDWAACSSRRTPHDDGRVQESGVRSEERVLAGGRPEQPIGRRTRSQGQGRITSFRRWQSRRQCWILLVVLVGGTGFEPVTPAV